MIKRLFGIYAWVLLSIGAILTSWAALAIWYFPQKTAQNLAQTEITPLPSTIPESGEVQGISTIMETADARPIIVARFLERYNSPLKPYEYFGKVFVELADKYNVDFRLLPAIAMQESNLCKTIPPGSFNCLGFGIHERGTLEFESFEANFERAARELKANYIDIGLTSPEEIMHKYTPSSDGSWAESVNQWMAEMRYDDRTKGLTSEDDANLLEFTQ